jgi:MoxR-like ATPase
MEVSLAIPQETQETGIRRGLLEDLALKILYLNGEMSLIELSHHICLSPGVVDEIFQFFRKEQLCEVKGMIGGSHRIAASMQGKLRAAGLLSLSQYAGPAPVSLGDYRLRVRAQSVQQAVIHPLDLERAFHQLVLDQDIVSRLGAAVVSGTSVFLHGPSGTGKTSIANSIAAIYTDSVWIPYAIEVDNQIITIYDPGVHHPVEGAAVDDSDKRWILCPRPRVFVGGELSAEMLDLQYSQASRFCTAPIQMKANNGVLIIDDFGRQRMRPEELLNRWMTPLDRRIDFLTLPGGRKFEVPFDLFAVFSTNLNPRQLADEAFLRRIPNKIKVDYATPAQFLEIFRRECSARLLSYDSKIAEQLIPFIADEMKQPLCPCHPGDLLNQVSWTATFRGEQIRVDRDMLERACRSYFLSTERG